MSLPQNLEPPVESTPTPVETLAESTPEAPVVEAEAPVVEEEESPEEIASDSALRTWARDNGIEDVPASGRLSAAWREQITAAMAAALDPKDEASAESDSSPESSTSVETMTEETTSTSGEETSPPTEESEEEAPAEIPLTGPGSSQPEFAHGGTEYRSVFQAPNTFVDSQAFTS